MNQGTWAAARALSVVLISTTALASCDGGTEKSPLPSAETSKAPTPVAPVATDPSPALVPATATALPKGLADTAWRLVEIQSMSDKVGTAHPDEPSRYTMQLLPDGTVTMVLNCNRATGKWSAEPSADPASGRFEFGPLTTTKTLCPPPSLDDRISSQAQYVRGYLLKDGRLNLSLMADGGIYVWEPLAEKPFQTEPDPALEAAILRAEPSYTREVVDIGGSTGRGRYVYGRVDLNGDRREEVFVYLLGSIFCGTGGCNMLLFTPSETGYRLVNNFPISRLPVVVSATRTEGWNDLIRPESGGGATPSYVHHVFDGKHYVMKERMPADKAPEGTSYLAGELFFQKGIPLEPKN